MEDRNAVAADCIVICCCCECMILQIFILLLVKLPSKLVKSTKRYARKLRTRKKGTKIVQIELRKYDEDSLRHRRTSFRIDFEELFSDESIGCCMDEIGTVLDEFSSRGEFAFGSFWGGDVSPESFRSCLEQDEVDYDLVRHRLVELFGSVNFHQQSF